MNSEFDALCKKCPHLATLLEEQREKGLPRKKWRAVMRLFIDAGRISLAREFSKQSDKHDYESDEVIDTLSLQRRDETVYCGELGCEMEDVEYTGKVARKFNAKKCVANKKGKVSISPYFKMRLTMDEKEEIGFRYEDDAYKGMNENRYARFIMQNYNLMHHDSDRYYIYCDNCWKVFGEFRMKKVLRSFFHKFQPDAWKIRTENTYMSALRYECYDNDDLKTAEDFINVKNGLLDLNSDEIALMSHDKMVFSTTQIPIEYDSEAQCPEFKKFLRVIFKRDKELIQLVQEIMGYCLSSSVRAHKMFIFLGGGSNGKSVLCEIMTALAGGLENVSSVSLKDFGHKFSLSQIADKTLNISTENETSVALDTQLLKAITSGEPIQMEEKFQSPFTYKPYVKLVFAMNTLPYVKDKSYGFERRLIIIPFEVRFSESPRTKDELKSDPYLPDALMKELDGILAFAIRGLKRLRNNDYKFTESQKASEALEKYKEAVNPMLEYVRANIEADSDAEKIYMTPLRDHFTKWCRDEGYKNMAEISARTFWQSLQKELDAEGYVYHKNKKGSRDLRGLKVKGLNARKRTSWEASDDLSDELEL